MNDVWLYLYWGDWERVRELDEALGVPEDRTLAAQIDSTRMFMAAMRGEFAEAEHFLERMSAAYEGLSKANELANVHTSIAHLRLAQGRLEEAFDAAMASLANPETATQGAQYAGYAAFWLKDAERADAAVAALAKGSPPLRYGQAARAEVLGLQAAVHGDIATARQNLRLAIDLFRSIRQPLWYSMDDLVLVSILGLADPEGRAAADEAREVFTRLGLKPYLAWLERAIDESAPAVRPSPRPAADVSAVPAERA
jgi:hypothetical protein